MSKTKNNSVNQSVVRLLEVLLLKFSEQKFTKQSVDLNFKDFMKLIAKKDINTLKAITKKDLEILKNTKIMFRTDDSSYTEITICKSSTKVVKNNIHFVLSNELYKILKHQGDYVFVPLDLIRFNEKYSPNNYLIFKKVLSSLGTEIEATISIRELYKYCVTLPRVEDVKRTNRAYTQRIRRPLEDALNSISEISWKYEDTEDMTFAKWLNTNIRVRKKNDAKVA